MPHRDAPDLVGQIGDFLNHRIDAAQFWRWFVAAMPAIEGGAPEDLVDLAWRVEHRFAEFTGGYIDEATLRAAIGRELSAAGSDPAATIGRRGAAAR